MGPLKLTSGSQMRQAMSTVRSAHFLLTLSSWEAPPPPAPPSPAPSAPSPPAPPTAAATAPLPALPRLGANKRRMESTCVLLQQLHRYCIWCGDAVGRGRVRCTMNWCGCWCTMCGCCGQGTTTGHAFMLWPACTPSVRAALVAGLGACLASWLQRLRRQQQLQVPEALEAPQAWAVGRTCKHACAAGTPLYMCRHCCPCMWHPLEGTRAGLPQSTWDEGTANPAAAGPEVA